VWVGLDEGSGEVDQIRVVAIRRSAQNDFNEGCDF
jgi:hypothetical protein